jgi:hypothetical protein
MLADSAATQARYRRTLVFWLCLLAVAFAVEAKTAWYGPMQGPGCAVRAAKALPADLPRVVEHGVAAPDPAHPPVSITVLAALKPERSAARILSPSNALLPSCASVVRSACFSPHFFFRPPPVNS